MRRAIVVTVLALGASTVIAQPKMDSAIRIHYEAWERERMAFQHVCGDVLPRASQTGFNAKDARERLCVEAANRKYFLQRQQLEQAKEKP